MLAGATSEKLDLYAAHFRTSSTFTNHSPGFLYACVYNILMYGMLCHIMLRYVMVCCILSCYAMLCDACVYIYIYTCIYGK